MILRKADGVTWMGTGSTWRSPNFEQDGKYQLNFSEWRGDRQTIFFAESTDLLHLDSDWARSTSSSRTSAGTNPRAAGTASTRSRVRAAGCTATGPPTRRAVRAWASASRWTACIGKRWSRRRLWTAHRTAKPARSNASGRSTIMLLGSGGMKTLVADQPQGPFRPARKNFTLLHGGPTYFARFFPTNPDGLLINHHAIAKNGRIHLGLLKRAVTDDEPTLRLGWWSGNERLKHEPLPVRLHPLPSPRRTAGDAGRRICRRTTA